MLKRLKYIGQCLEELSALGVTGTDDTNPPSNYSTPSHSDSKLMLRPVVSPQAVEIGRKFQQEFLQELPGLMGQPGEALRHHAAWYTSLLHALCIYKCLSIQAASLDSPGNKACVDQGYHLLHACKIVSSGTDCVLCLKATVE